jgi:RNA polymerase sigma-70 factor (ECF subfamily)
LKNEEPRVAADDRLATRPSLLLKVRDARDSAAWERFVNAYTPIVFGFCRKRGLQAADASDVAQDVLQSVAQHVPNFDYDPRKGRFRDWLFRVTRNKVTDFHRRRKNEAAGSGMTEVHRRIEAQPAVADDDADWDAEWQRYAFERAAAEVRAEFADATWKAFWATAVEGRDVKAVASELGISSGAVYIAKSRVTARIKAAVAAEE